MVRYEVLSVDGGGKTWQEEGVLIAVSCVLPPRAPAETTPFASACRLRTGFLNARRGAASPGTTLEWFCTKLSLVRHLPCERETS